MSFNFLQNIQPASFAEAMFNWMQFMTASTTAPTNPGAGWTCVASGDGLSSYQTNSSAITGSGTGAGGMKNNKAWFVLKQPNQPNLNRQFCFQVGSSDSNWRVKYSFSGFNLAGANATTTPSASDEQILLGSGTDAAPVMSQLFSSLTAGSFVSSFGASTDGYSFFSFSYPKGYLRNADSIKNLMIFDDLKFGTYNVADADPCLMYISASSANNNTLLMTTSADHPWGTTKFKGYVCKGMSNKEAFVNISIAGWGTPSGAWAVGLPNAGINCWCPNPNQELNPHNGSEDLCPIFYFYKNNNSPNNLDPSQGYKGTSNNFFMGSMQRNNGDFYNYDDLSGDPQGKKIYISGFALPWNNQNPTQ